MRLGSLLAGVALALTLAPLSFSQTAPASPSAAVYGVVVDEARRPLARVEVELIDLATGRIRRIDTDLAGRFSFSGLPTGRYTLSFLADGYAARRLPPRELLPDSPVEVTVELEPLGPPLTRPRAGIESVALEYGLVREQIADLPVLLGYQGRTAIDKLLHLTPGLTPVESLEVDPLSGVGAAVSANGSRRSAINYRLDGASNNAQNRQTGAQASTFAPVPDAVETFRVITHTYSARDGRNAGAVVAPVTRSGGEAWHGGLRGFFRPRGDAVEFFDGSEDALRGFAGGGQIGGPLWAKRKLYGFVDAEGWLTAQRYTEVGPALSAAERSGDLSARGEPVIDPATGPARLPFPNGIIPEDRLDPLVQRYLDALVPVANDLASGEPLYRGRNDLDSSGQTSVARLDWKPSDWTVTARHLLYRSDAELPPDDIALSPGVTDARRQIANNALLSVAWAPAPSFQQTTLFSGQRLSLAGRQGIPAFEGVTADELGFDFSSFGAEVGAIPDVTVYGEDGFPRLHIAPFLASENSVQTTYQVRHDAQWRPNGRFLVRGGALYRRGLWPYVATDNFAGSFSFPAPPPPGGRAASGGLVNFLLARPGQYRLSTPRELDLRWDGWATYAEVEARPLRSLSLTAGVRFDVQPPAYDTQNRIAAFRRGVRSQRFPPPDTPAGLLFPGERDGERGVLPRSTVATRGRNTAPRFGVAYSPSVDSRLARWIFGDSGRSVFRASYGLFYDFGAFAGSSAAALQQARFPPFSVDNRFPISQQPPGEAFRRPLAFIGVDNPLDRQVSRLPIFVFDREFQNAYAEHFNAGYQRLLPGGVFLSAVYVRTRGENLQRQRELNTFVRSPLLGFFAVRSMRLISALDDVRQFESTGSSEYEGFQFRANRYLRRGLAFDVGYTWSESFDDGSSVFGDALATEAWAPSSFDRRHNLSAIWLYEPRIPRSWSPKLRWLDRWTISGAWRWRSGLPLDIRQSEDPTFTFERVGRPDLVGEFRLLDPGRVRTFTLADGREVTGRFAFDPTVFQRVTPTDFDETRPGTVERNQFRLPGFQQWDLRLARPVDVSENLEARFGFDLLNVFGSRNWAEPFRNIDHPYFGIVQSEGLGRTVQGVVRLTF